MSNQLNPLRMALLGCGTVGQSVVTLLQENQKILETRRSTPWKLTHVVVRDLAKQRHLPSDCVVTTDVLSVVNDPNVDVVIELMGDTPLADQAIEQSLKSRKHVVTANKAWMARKGAQYFDLAQKNGVKILFEASVAGAIPILRVLREGISPNQISSVRGIINGTTNYILSAMTNQGSSFDEALSEAQQLGYAEADPSADVDGHDAAYKITLLALMTFGVSVLPEEVHTEGIRHLSQLDIQMAHQFGYRIKLLGITEQLASGVSVRVHPTLLPFKNPLAHVQDAFNAIQYIGDRCGMGMLMGRGAGGNPTASAVVSDLLELSRSFERQDTHHSSPTGILLEHVQITKPIALDNLKSSFYLRFSVQDRPTVLARIAQELGQEGVSLSNIYQNSSSESGEHVHVFILTHVCEERALRRALEVINHCDFIVAPTVSIRIASEEIL